MKNRNFFLILLFFLLCKILIAFFLPVFADEAYYYIWSLKPQLSYFDHPPFVSWLTYLGTTFFPANSPLALRSFFILASTLTSMIWIVVLRKKSLSDSDIICFLILTMLNPLLGAGSVVATPDVPLVLFWSLSYLAFLGIFEEGSSLKRHCYYALLGAALGLGFCSKYHIVLFVLSGLIYIFFDKTYRKIKITGVLITLLTGALFSLPVLVWNYRHDWSSFTFQLKHGFGKKNYDWTWTIQFYLGQLALMSPFIFLNLFQRGRQKLDRLFSATQIGFFTTSSFKAVVEANWPITSHLHSTVHFLQNMTRKKWLLTLGYWVFIYSAMVIALNLPSVKRNLRNQYRSTQMDELMPLVEKYKPLYGSSYQISSLMSWRSGVFIPKLKGLSRFDFFDTLPESTPDGHRIFVLKHFDSIWPDDYQKYNKTRLESFDNLQIELYQLSYE